MAIQLAVPVTDRDHIRGRQDAPVTLLEYGDFECPHCGQAHPIVSEVQERAGDVMRFVYRHFPLAEIHPHAVPAAQAAESAGAHHRFWEMHDILFENQDRLDMQDLIQYAVAAGLDPLRFAHDLTTGRFVDRVREDFLGGVQSGVRGTPTFFINGVRHEGSYELPDLLAAVLLAAEREQGTRAMPQPRWGDVFPRNMGG